MELTAFVRRSQNDRLFHWSVETPDGEVHASSHKGFKSAERAAEHYRSLMSLQPMVLFVQDRSSSAAVTT